MLQRAMLQLYFSLLAVLHFLKPFCRRSQNGKFLARNSLVINCPDVHFPRCPGFLLPLCSSSSFPRCPGSLLPRCSNSFFPRCPGFLFPAVLLFFVPAGLVFFFQLSWFPFIPAILVRVQTHVFRKYLRKDEKLQRNRFSQLVF